MASSLREQVDSILPTWERWYPSLFEAARDLGVIRAYVCSPSSLLLSNRHSQVRREAEVAHKDKWGGVAEETGNNRRRKRKR